MRQTHFKKMVFILSISFMQRAIYCNIFVSSSIFNIFFHLLNSHRLEMQNVHINCDIEVPLCKYSIKGTYTISTPCMPLICLSFLLFLYRIIIKIIIGCAENRSPSSETSFFILSLLNYFNWLTLAGVHRNTNQTLSCH